MRCLVISDVRTTTILTKLIENENLGTVVKELEDKAFRQVLSEKKIELVFVDLHKIHLSEWEDVQEELDKRIPTVLLTHMNDLSRVNETHLAGIYYYINKPINKLEVISIVKLIKKHLSFSHLVRNLKEEINDLRSINKRKKDMLLSLTSSDIEVLKLLNQGYTHAQASEKMYLSVNTLKSQTKRIRRKLGVKETIEAVKIAKQWGLF